MIIKVVSFFAAAACVTGSAVIADDAPPPPVVSVAKVEMVRETSPKRYAGAVEAVRRVDIMPRVTGNLLKTHFTEGAIVEEDALLYELEDTTYRAAVAALRAEKEQLEAALKYASAEFTRNDRLLRNQAVSVSTHDKAKLEINTAAARIKQIEASLLDAENTLSYTRIHSPITGRIGKNVFTEVNLITPQGGKLNDIEMIAPIYVRFSLSEAVFRRNFGGSERIGARALVRIQLADGTVYRESARVTLIDNKINAATNTITLWASFANADRQLIPGSFVTVLLSAVEEKPFTAVLPSALIAEPDGYCVYLLDESNHVVRRAVKIGDTAGALQVVRSGLDGSESVIVDGTHKVSPGMIAKPVAAAN